jgi:hypothetical protein
MVSLAGTIAEPPPGWLPQLTDPAIRDWACHLHKLWGMLGRQVIIGQIAACQVASGFGGGCAKLAMCGLRCAFCATGMTLLLEALLGWSLPCPSPRPPLLATYCYCYCAATAAAAAAIALLVSNCISEILLLQLLLQLSPSVRECPELHTMLWVPNPFVVPGARFREVYYWDSLWVIKGLLVSRLLTIAQVCCVRCDGMSCCAACQDEMGVHWNVYAPRTAAMLPHSHVHLGYVSTVLQDCCALS